MVKKNWFLSKTMWVAVIAAVVAVLQAMGIAIPNEVYGVLGALGLWGLRTAKTEVG